MIPIFDLDDTLYDERSYVLGGFGAVARWGEARFGQDAEESLNEMVALLDRDGRGRVFDDWLRGRAPVREAIRQYRCHEPQIALTPEAEAALDYLAGRPLYLVTDGHKLVQARKVAALGVAPRFRHCYLTNRYGAHHAKPSLYCFELIRAHEHAEWSELIYIGDNPAKDFVALNAVGATTIRVLTGRHAKDRARAGHDARYRLTDLSELPLLMDEICPPPSQ